MPSRFCHCVGSPAVYIICPRFIKKNRIGLPDGFGLQKACGMRTDKHSVLVNSDTSANLFTMSMCRESGRTREAVLTSLTWVSEITSVVQCAYKRGFMDIDRRTPSPKAL